MASHDTHITGRYSILSAAIGAIVGAVATGLVSYYFIPGEAGVSKSKYNDLKTDYDIVVSEKENLVKENIELNEKNEQLNIEIKDMKNSISELEGKLEAKLETEKVENTSLEGISFRKISNILYKGKEYKLYDGDNDSFVVGGNTYREGFAIGYSGGLFGEGAGYALFNLGNKYSKMTFEVGGMGENTSDATFYITSSDGLINQTEYLEGHIPSKQVEINLNYVGDLKIALDTGQGGYGFYNVFLHE